MKALIDIDYKKQENKIFYYTLITVNCFHPAVNATLIFIKIFLVNLSFTDNNRNNLFKFYLEQTSSGTDFGNIFEF